MEFKLYGGLSSVVSPDCLTWKIESCKVSGQILDCSGRVENFWVADCPRGNSGLSAVEAQIYPERLSPVLGRQKWIADCPLKAGGLSAPALSTWDPAGRPYLFLLPSLFLLPDAIRLHFFSLFLFSTKITSSSISWLEWFPDGPSTSPDTPRHSPPCLPGILSNPFLVCLDFKFKGD